MKKFMFCVYVILLLILILWNGEPSFTEEEMIDLGLPQDNHQEQLYREFAEVRHN